MDNHAFVLPTYPEQRDKDDVKQRHLNRDSSELHKCFNTLYVKGIGQLVRKYFFAFFQELDKKITTTNAFLQIKQDVKY